MTSISPEQEDLGVGWMHIYPQSRPHAPAMIRGNRLALERLRKAIDEVLAGPASTSAEVFARDGEGFAIQVVRVSLLSDVGQPFYLQHPADGR